MDQGRKQSLLFNRLEIYRCFRRRKVRGEGFVRELVIRIPDVDAFLALAPEELGSQDALPHASAESERSFGHTPRMDRVEIADVRHQHCRLEKPLNTWLCNIGVLRQHDQPVPVDSCENVSQYPRAGQNNVLSPINFER